MQLVKIQTLYIRQILNIFIKKYILTGCIQIKNNVLSRREYHPVVVAAVTVSFLKLYKSLKQFPAFFGWLVEVKADNEKL